MYHTCAKGEGYPLISEPRRQCSDNRSALKCPVYRQFRDTLLAKAKMHGGLHRSDWRRCNSIVRTLMSVKREAAGCQQRALCTTSPGL